MGEELPVQLLLFQAHTGYTLMIDIVHYVDLVKYFNHAKNYLRPMTPLRAGNQCLRHIFEAHDPIKATP